MTLRQTPLNSRLKALNAMMVPYAGYEMSVRFTNIKEEHNAVRTNAGIFDVSHMSEFWFEGKDALKAVNRLITNDLSRADNFDVQYNFMCTETGGIVDDLMAYKFSDTKIMLVMNAACHNTDVQHIKMHLQGDVIFTDKSYETAQIAIQGPKAVNIIASITDNAYKDLKTQTFTGGVIAGCPCLISRTGYTGEDGYEIYFSNDDSGAVFDTIMEAGKPFNLIPVGLGARDTLRLEAKMPLYGNELDLETTPLEARLGWGINLDKSDFIGKDILLEQKTLKSLSKKLFGLKMVDKAIGRHGYKVVDIDNPEKIIGYVTSGSPSPTLDCNIALAYLPPEGYKTGKYVGINIRGKIKRAVIIKTPFYKRKK